MFQLHAIEAVDPMTQRVNVIVDTPKGSRNKFKYDEERKLFRLSRVLPIGMSFPYDFGSIPRTCAADGDALDVLLLTDAPTFSGCLVATRLIGVLRATQKERGSRVRNDRLIGVVETPVNEPEITDLSQLPTSQLHEIEHFFVAYNAAHGREFSVEKRQGHGAAQKLLRAAIRAWRPR